MPKAKRFTWNAERLAALRTRYPHERTADLARALGCTSYAARLKARRLGIRKEPGSTTHAAPIGSQRIDSHGYRQVKLSHDRRNAEHGWEYLHVWLYEQHHGRIPYGSHVTFRDGDRANVTLENLRLVTQRDIMQQHSLTRYPLDLRHAIVTINTLKRTIHEKQDRRPA